MSATLSYLLEPLPWLSDDAVEDICIQGPGECWVYKAGAFTRYPLNLDEHWTEDIAIVAAAQRQQDISASRPLLHTSLPGDETRRLMAVVYPCVARGHTSLTFRRGSKEWPSLDHLDSTGLFKHARVTKQRARDEQLLALYRTEQWAAFLREAVWKKKNIILCGTTGSGKTHISKALLAEVPLDERLITIEDSAELSGNPHPNTVSLYYDKEGNGTTPADLVEAALRMRIGRLFLQEIRDGRAAVAFLVALQTGHSGGITTIHAGDCAAVFDRLRVIIKQTPWGAAISDADLVSQLKALVDVVVHAARGADGSFAVDEVWFRDCEG